MKRIVAMFLLIAASLLISSCADARMDQRKPPYDAAKCPFCTPKPGSCDICKGSGKCAYCDGTGRFTVSTKNYAEKDVAPTSYKIVCPYCHGSGKCSLCGGSGKCARCKGTGKAQSDWNFGGKYVTKIDTSTPAPDMPVPPQSAAPQPQEQQDENQ